MFTLWSIDLSTVVLLAGAAGSVATAVFVYMSYRLSQRRPLVGQVLQDVLLPP